MLFQYNRLWKSNAVICYPTQLYEESLSSLIANVCIKCVFIDSKKPLREYWLREIIKINDVNRGRPSSDWLLTFYLNFFSEMYFDSYNYLRQIAHGYVLRTCFRTNPRPFLNLIRGNKWTKRNRNALDSEPNLEWVAYTSCLMECCIKIKDQSYKVAIFVNPL